MREGVRHVEIKYAELMSEIKLRIRSAQTQAMSVVNAELIVSIGKSVA